MLIREALLLATCVRMRCDAQLRVASRIASARHRAGKRIRDGGRKG